MAWNIVIGIAIGIAAVPVLMLMLPLILAISVLVVELVIMGVIYVLCGLYIVISSIVGKLRGKNANGVILTYNLNTKGVTNGRTRWGSRKATDKTGHS